MSCRVNQHIRHIVSRTPGSTFLRTMNFGPGRAGACAAAGRRSMPYSIALSARPADHHDTGRHRAAGRPEREARRLQGRSVSARQVSEPAPGLIVVRGMAGIFPSAPAKLSLHGPPLFCDDQCQCLCLTFTLFDVNVIFMCVVDDAKIPRRIERAGQELKQEICEPASK